MGHTQLRYHRRLACGCSPQAEGPSEPGTGSIIAAGEAGRWSVVPVAVPGDIPFQIAEELDVKRGIGVGTNAPRIGNCREQSHAGAETGFAEPKKLCFRGDQCGGEILLLQRKDRRLIGGTLPSGSPNYRDAHAIGIPEIASDSAPERALQRDTLL